MKRLAVLIVIFALGISVGFMANHRWRSVETDGQRLMEASGRRETAMEHAKRHLDPKYVCPMHPDVIQDRPGTCPICGMKLVAKAEETGVESGAIVISPAVVNLLGVRTAKVRRGAIPRRIEALGYLNLQAVQPLVQATVPSAAPAGEQAAQEPAAAPAPATQVLVLAQVFERQSLWVRPGQNVEIRLPVAGAKVWKGKIDSVDQQVNPVTRTVQIRILADPTGVELKGNMYAQVTIEADPVDNVLVVPNDALIETGRGARVIVALGGGRFQPREVVAEPVSDEAAAIRSGLTEGEEVVVSSHFLLDSEASLQAGLSRLASERGESGPAMEWTKP